MGFRKGLGLKGLGPWGSGFRVLGFGDLGSGVYSGFRAMILVKKLYKDQSPRHKLTSPRLTRINYQYRLYNNRYNYVRRGSPLKRT